MPQSITCNRISYATVHNFIECRMPQSIALDATSCATDANHAMVHSYRSRGCKGPAPTNQSENNLLL